MTSDIECHHCLYDKVSGTVNMMGNRRHISMLPNSLFINMVNVTGVGIVAGDEIINTTCSDTIILLAYMEACH